MNVTLENHLQTIRNCDAKNLSRIINEYSHYTQLEELFHQAIVERSLKTGYEDSKRYVDEAQILDFFRNPWNYRDIPYLNRLLEYFLQEWYYPESKLSVLNDIFSSNLKDYTYEGLLRCFDEETSSAVSEVVKETEDPKDHNTSRHLEWLSLHYISEYTRILKQHTKLSDLEIDMLLEVSEEYQYRFRDWN